MIFGPLLPYFMSGLIPNQRQECGDVGGWVSMQLGNTLPGFLEWLWYVLAYSKSEGKGGHWAHILFLTVDFDGRLATLMGAPGLWWVPRDPDGLHETMIDVVVSSRALMGPHVRHPSISRHYDGRTWEAGDFDGRTREAGDFDGRT